ncbi:PorT family protein [Halosquirtibacter laminarini]|uniref:PorT family protein n=1 Tax=Halosquirtibacter laminarini TaxID=3374600 RepID=A0AC61NK91_9BACT|nr:PorT family protein [Prolixibacteraceae bacterium]
MRYYLLIILVFLCNTYLYAFNPCYHDLSENMDTVVVSPQKVSSNPSVQDTIVKKDSTSISQKHIEEMSEEWFKNNSSSNQKNEDREVGFTKEEIFLSDSGFDDIINIFGHDTRKNYSKKFRARWSLIDIGVNSLMNTSYEMYPVSNDFMDIDNNKSTEFALNLFRLPIGLSRTNNRIGLFTGLGVTWNNYRFNQSYTIEDKGGMVQPVSLSDENIIKSKLVTTYLSFPLMFQYQFAIPGSRVPLCISVGITGEIKLGSHTKVKTDTAKRKDHDDFQLVPFRYSYSARAKYGFISFYFKYYEPGLFQSGNGPTTTPMTFGIGLF